MSVPHCEVGAVFAVVDEREIDEKPEDAGTDKVPDAAGDEEEERESVRELVDGHRAVLTERLVEYEDERDEFERREDAPDRHPHIGHSDHQ